MSEQRPAPDDHSGADRLQHLRGLAVTLSEVYGYLADQAHDEEQAGYGDEDDDLEEGDHLSPYPGVRDRVFAALAARTPNFTEVSPEAIHDDWAADDPATLLASPEALALLDAAREAFDLIQPIAVEDAKIDAAEGVPTGAPDGDEERSPFIGWSQALERALDAILGIDGWEGRPQWVTEAMEVHTSDLARPRQQDTAKGRAHVAMAKRLAHWDNEYEIGVTYLTQQGMTEAGAMRALGLGQQRATPAEREAIEDAFKAEDEAMGAPLLAAPAEQPVWEPRVVVTLTKPQARVLAAILSNVSDDYADGGDDSPAVAYVDEANRADLGTTLDAILTAIKAAPWLTTAPPTPTPRKEPRR